MQSQDPISAGENSLWQKLARLTTIKEITQFWQEYLVLLLEQTEASGAWLSLVSPCPMSLHAGQVNDATLAWLESWSTSVHPATETTALVEHVGPTTLLCIACGEAGHENGCVAFVYEHPRDLTADECTGVASMVRATMAIANQTAELHQTHENLHRVRHLYEVGQAIASTLDLDQVLKQSTERVTEVLHAEASTLMLVDEARRQLVFEIPAGPAEDILREQRMPMDKGVAGWAATHGEPVIIPNVGTDDRFYTDIDRLTGYRTQSIMAIPLQVKGKITGVVEVINKTDGTSFTQDDQQWLSILTPLIAVAIENARLFTALREERDRIVAAEETVRHEMARTLHDGPAQILAAIILNIDMARRHLTSGPEKMATELNFLDSLAQEANQEIRDLLFSLRPVTLETRGLSAALVQLVERTQPHVSYRIHLDLEPVPEGAIDTKTSGTVFVIVQEAMNNIQKHAKASNVSIHLHTSETSLWVEVADDGVGFNVRDTEANYGRLNSFGLLNMRERSRLIEGHTEIISPCPGSESGTLVRVEVPIDRPSRAS